MSTTVIIIVLVLLLAIVGTVAVLAIRMLSDISKMLGRR